MTKLKSLFQPIAIGRVELKNRIVMTCANASGGGGKHVISYYAERARGGAGLLIVGGMYTFDTGPAKTFYGGRKDVTEEEARAIREFALYGEELLPGLREFTATTHDNGAKVAAQLLMTYEWKRDWKTDKEGPTELVSPSGGPSGARLGDTRAVTVDEIQQIVEEYGDAAGIAQQAGFDAIEIHAGIGYFLNQFLSPHTNRRIDGYGGSLENRMRILLEIVDSCQKKTGKDFPIIARISVEDFIEGGNTLEDTTPIAMALERAGIIAIDVETGWHESPVPMVQQWVKPGAFVYLAEEIKKIVNIPVLTAYRIWDPVLADRIIAEGKADLIGMARALVADPELPNKAREGRFDDINYCIACCRCLDTAIGGECPSCAVNARVGREAIYTIKPAAESKNLLVIGGGPAGMEAARVAALRGHRVTLCDRGRRLGGSLLLASIMNPEIPKFLKYQTRQLQKLPVEIRLNEEVDAYFLERMKPDEVIVATGGKAPAFEIPGTHRDNVLLGHEMLEAMVRPPGKGGVLSRLLWRSGSLALRYLNQPALIRWGLRFGFPFRERVVIIGGGFAGCELADVLAERGKKVTILEQSHRIGYDIGITTRWVVRMRLWNFGVRMERDVRVVEITEKGVRAMVDDSETFFEADTVALTMPLVKNDKLAQELEEAGWHVHSIGDCAEPGRIMEAMAAGFRSGLEV